MTDRREQIDIVLHVTSDYKEKAKTGATCIRRVVRSHGISDIQALRLIVDVMRQFEMVMEFTQYLPKPQQIPVNKYLKHVEKKGRYFLPVEAGGLKFSFGWIPLFNHAFLSIEEVATGLETSWAAWVAPFLAIDGFVQAWVTDAEYDYWQNVKDPLQYEEAGRSYSHLPTKLNGLPPPLEQMEIDISNNPCRWILQSGFREAIGSTMWLSPLFWHLTGTGCKDAELSANGFDVQHEANGIIKVVAADHCFCDETTENVQRKLRSILFN